MHNDWTPCVRRWFLTRSICMTNAQTHLTSNKPNDMNNGTDVISASSRPSARFSSRVHFPFGCSASFRTVCGWSNSAPLSPATSDKCIAVRGGGRRAAPTCRCHTRDRDTGHRADWTAGTSNPNRIDRTRPAAPEPRDSNVRPRDAIRCSCCARQSCAASFTSLDFSRPRRLPSPINRCDEQRAAQPADQRLARSSPQSCCNYARPDACCRNCEHACRQAHCAVGVEAQR